VKQGDKGATIAELRPIVQGQKYADKIVVDKGVERAGEGGGHRSLDGNARRPCAGRSQRCGG
jgi:hypothetical protein